MSKTLVRGIIIDKRRFKDKSLIINVLVESGELFSGLLYEKKGQSPLHYLGFYDFLAVDSPGRDLQVFSEFHFLEGPFVLDPSFSDQYYVVAEICRILFRDEHPGQDIFSFLNVELKYFSGNYNPDFHILFLAKLITIYGYTPLSPFEGIYFDLREGLFCHQVPLHPDYCEAGSIKSVFDFINGNSEHLTFLNAKDRFNCFNKLLRFLELQKGIKLSLKSIDILRELRD